jgi:hypothetical protein
MTRKQWGEILVKQIVTIVTTLAIVLLTLALKAPFLFKQNMEKELDKKADKTEVEKKLDIEVFEIHSISQDNKIEALEKKHDSEYNALIKRIDDYANNVDNRFVDIKELIKANSK